MVRISDACGGFRSISEANRHLDASESHDESFAEFDCAMIWDIRRSARATR